MFFSCFYSLQQQQFKQFALFRMQGFNYARNSGVDKAGEGLPSPRQTIDLTQVFEPAGWSFLIKNNGFSCLILKSL